MHHSPFEKFRTNQKFWMAILAIVSMISFVVIPAFTKWNDPGTGSSSKDPRSDVVVTSKYGDLTESDIRREMVDRRMTAKFLQAIVQEKYSKIIRDIKDPTIQQQAMRELYGYHHPYFRQDIPSRGYQVFMQHNAASEQDVVDQIVTEKLAEELGINVTDAMVTEYLVELRTEFDTTSAAHRPIAQITSEEMEQLSNSMRKNTSSFNIDTVVNEIRNFLLRSKYQVVGLQRGEIDSPLKRWENYSKVSRRAGVEIIPVNAEVYVNNVEDPKPEELEKFFNERKGKTQDLAQAEKPDEFGFRLPRRASFQFYQINEDKLLDSFKPSVSEKEIQEYYEKNKTQFPVQKLQDLNKEKGDEKKADETKKDEAKKSESDSAATAPQAGDKPEEDKKSDEKKPEEKKPAEPTSKAKASSSSSREPLLELSNAKRVIPVAFQTKDTTDKAGKTTDAAKSDAGKSGETKGDTAKPDAGKTVANPADAKAGDAKPSDPKTDAKPEPAVEYEPLEKVRDKIVTELARERANKRRDELLENMRQEMVSFADKYRDAIYAKEHENKESNEIPAFKMEQVKNDDSTIKYGEITLASPRDLIERDLGKSSTRLASMNQDVNFTQFAFAKGIMHLYSPCKTYSFAPSLSFLVWKTNMKSEEEPSLSDPDTRQRVVHAWKLTKARDLAKAEAQRLADKAKESKKKFSVLSKEVTDVPAPLVEPGFSWSILRGQSNAPELTSLPNVDGMSSEFMQTVFGLDEGGTGVAFNNKKSTAYAIYVTYMDKPDKYQTSYLQDVRTLNAYTQYQGANIEEIRELSIEGRANAMKRFQFVTKRDLKGPEQQQEE